VDFCQKNAHLTVGQFLLLLLLMLLLLLVLLLCGCLYLVLDRFIERCGRPC
jgi:hypothetical protein